MWEMSVPRCHYCSQPINTGIPVVLWDGETYCSQCVEAVDPGLIEYARTHTELVETLTAQDLQLWRTFTRPRNVGILLVIFVPMFALFFTFLALAIAQNEIVACCWGECCLCVIGLSMFVMFIPIEQAYIRVIGDLPRT